MFGAPVTYIRMLPRGNMSRPNILLVILDSVRAANSSTFGHRRDTTPFLTRYADQATLYQQARAPGIHSIASHASMWTGSQVEQHRAVEHNDRLLPGVTIWDELSEEGYETGVFTENVVVAHASNLSEPFDTRVTTDRYVDKGQKLFPDAHSPSDVNKHEGVQGNIRRCLEHDSPLKSFINCGHHFYLKRKERVKDDPMTTPELVEQFLDWQAERDDPWAACLNLMDAHYPYEPTDEFDIWGGDELRDLHSQISGPQSREFLGDRPWWQLEAFEALYDGTIRELDYYVKDLIAGLKQSAVHDDTLVVITSDHGEGFGEASRLNGRTKMVDHSWGIHEVLTHVPLIVKYPEQTQSEVIGDPATLSAFPETVRRAMARDYQLDSFASTEPVICSTYRLQQSDVGRFDDIHVDTSEYTGPWRAVYEQSENHILKYSTKDEYSSILEIFDAQHARPIQGNGAEKVTETFNDLEDKNLVEEKGEVLKDDIEDRLTDLGYLT